ncbi:MAG: serine protein kinase RIO, partial [Bacteroidetes bacterium]
FARSTVDADVAEVLQVIDDAREQEAERRQRELAAREDN